MTNPEKFQAIITALTTGEISAEAAQEIVEWAQKNIESIAAKAEKDAIKRAEKKANTDVLTQAVKAALTNEPMTIEAVVEAVGDVPEVEVTAGKVRSALSFLVRQEMAKKEEVKIEGKRKVVYTA